MGLFGNLFSRSSTCASSEPRNWTHVSQTKLDDDLHHQDAGLLRELDRNELVLTGSRSANNEQAREDSLGPLGQARPPVYLEQGPSLTRIMAHAGTGDSKGVSVDSCADSRHSMRDSRRLTDFATLLRPRKSRHQKSKINAPEPPGACTVKVQAVENPKNSGIPCTMSNAMGGHQSSGGRKVFQWNNHLQEPYAPRKASDRTIHSHKSNLTSVTVCHHPSRRTSTPITLVHREHGGQDPFDEPREPCHRLPCCNPFSEPSITTTSSTRQVSSDYSDINFEMAQIVAIDEKKENPFDQEYISDHKSVSLKSSSRTVSRDSTWPIEIDKHTAAIAFNELATIMHLDPLVLNKRDTTGAGSDQVAPVDGTFLVKENEPLRRRDRVLGRIRMMRSSLYMKAQPTVTQERTLRRMKTFASLSSRSCELSSLRGRSLESLARLGGHSFLSLPAEFAPGTLRLPTCFVATISYLKFFASSTPDVFCNAGDLKMAARIYGYFANQVLSAEKEHDRIEMTVRRGEMPLDMVGILDREASRQTPLQVLSVAWVFKALLAGLPGGILGSAQLYRILVGICYGRSIEGDDVPRSARGASPQGRTRIKAMGLAILVLTTPLQLNLICAFLGLCAMLVYETELVGELEQYGVHGSAIHSLTPGLLSVERLGRVLGPVLTPEAGSGDHDTFRAIEREIESQRVMTMLIGSWYSVNQQLRMWQNQGSFSRDFSWEPSSVATAPENLM